MHVLLQIEKRMIGYWLKLMTSKSTKLNHKIYRRFLQLNNRDIYSTNWICKIKQIMQRCGFYHLWSNQYDITTENKNAIQLMMNTRIDDQYEQVWRASIQDHIRCSSYALFKHPEPYVSKLCTSNRIYLAQFRCRSNKLPISKTYKPDMFYDTTYTLCTKNETGDEFHYLFIYLSILPRRKN